MNGYPDSPEAVALKLLERILDSEEPTRRTNQPPAMRMLALYGECLAAVLGRAETRVLQ